MEVIKLYISLKEKLQALSLAPANIRYFWCYYQIQKYSYFNMQVILPYLSLMLQVLIVVN